MRNSKSLLLVPVLGLGLGGCADERDDFPLPHYPVSDAVQANEPISDTVVDNAPPYERPDSVDIGEDVTPDRVFQLGRKSREAYDRLRAAGLVR